MAVAGGKKKNPAAVALGRLGGKKRAATLSAQELSDQGRGAAAARWGKSTPSLEFSEGYRQILDSAKPEPVTLAEPKKAVEPTLTGRESNVILALREQGYEVGEPVAHPDGFTRVDVRSHDVSAWVSVGQELLNLAAGRVTLEEIKNRQRSFAATGRA
jgi:hypothetical protein